MTKKSQPSVPGNKGIQFEEKVVINKSARELYDFWRDFKNLPKFMTVLNTVEVLTGGITRWHVDGPVGVRISWDAEVINDHPGELIAWKTLPDAQVQSAGSVRFKAIDQEQTEVKVSAEYLPPGGEIGMAIAALLLDDPEQRVRDDLIRFKQLMETGSVQS
jgi:uncharacterized membrane protein